MGLIAKLFQRSRTSAPYEPRRVGPGMPGAYLITLRSTPRHHDALKRVIQSSGSAHVFFSEPLAYISGKGVSMFRIEARTIDFLEDVYRFWDETQRAEAALFEIDVYVNNTEHIGTFRGSTAAEIKALIEANAPKVPANPETFRRTPRAVDA